MHNAIRYAGATMLAGLMLGLTLSPQAEGSAGPGVVGRRCRQLGVAAEPGTGMLAQPANCAPPRVAVAVDRDGVLRATVAAGTGAIRELRVGTAGRATQNAVIEIGGQEVTSGTTLVLPPPGSAQVAIAVRRDVAGAATTIPLLVVDECGPSETFFGAGTAVDVATAGPSQFEWLGPDRFAGRIRSVLVHPTNADIIYAGAATGGIWKSTTGGQTWVSLDDFMPTQVIGSLAMDPQDPNTIYAGTGEIFTFFAEGLWLRGQDRGQGIFVSRDAGTSWRALASTQTPSDDWRFVSRIAVDPNSSSHIFAATSTGLWQSTDTGQSFTKVLNGIYLDVKIHPLDPRNVVASSMGGPMMFSNDSGARWTASVFPSGTLTSDTRVELAPVTQQASQWRALAIRRASSGAPSGITGLFTSSNGGQSFTSLGSPTGVCAQTNRVYTGALWVDSQDATRMLIGATFLCKTTNNGVDFTQIIAPTNVPFVDLHAIVTPQGASDGILVGHDQGLKRVRNYSTGQPTVQDLNNSLRTTQFHSAVADPGTGNVIGGTQDIGTLQRISGTWHRVIGGDGIMVSRGSNIFYGGRTQGRVERTSVNSTGNTCFSATGSSPLAESQADSPHCGSSPVSTFCTDKTPLLIDPNEINRLYVGCRQLWRTPSARASDPASINWTSVKPADGNFVISTMDIPTGNANLMWLGTMRIGGLVGGVLDLDPRPEGRLWKSTNATAVAPTFDRMDDGKGLPARPVFDLAIDPRDNRKVYVTYSGFAADNLWKTTDSGATFTNIAAGLPAVPVWAIAVHPTRDGWLYAGTDVGLYTSTDDGATWSATTRGPATVAISDLQWKGSSTRLTVATYGRGVHEFDAALNPERVYPETATAATGAFTRGSVGNTLQSDDKRLVVSTSVVNEVLTVTLTTHIGIPQRQTPTISTLSLRTETLVSANAQQKLEVFDFLDNRWESVHGLPRTAGQKAARSDVLTDNIRRYIHPTSKELLARLTWTRSAAGAPFAAEIDFFQWSINRGS